MDLQNVDEDGDGILKVIVSQKRVKEDRPGFHATCNDHYWQG
jgi:hypothetical protein